LRAFVVKSSASIALAASVILAASLGMKVAVARAPAGALAPAPDHRSEELRRFLVASAGAAEPVSGGWKFAQGSCQVSAFPSEARGLLDMDILYLAGPNDRVAYVYRGRVSDRRPGARLSVDILLFLAARPFLGGREPGYTVLIARDCPALPSLPWEKLPA
jgi:hypothetical protein